MENNNTERNPLTHQEQAALAAQDALIEGLIAILQLHTTHNPDFRDDLATGYCHMHQHTRAMLARLRV